MEITWLGHSCFRIKGRQATVITDPYSPSLGYSLAEPKADIVTVSHQHEGHSYVQGVDGDPRAVVGPGEYEIKSILIIGIPTFHDNVMGAKRGKNTIYVMEVDEIAVCHLGDLGHVLTDDQVEELGEVDVLLLPVGGVSTVNAATAAEIVRQLEPRVVVPMHYKTPELKWELEPSERFLKEIGAKQVDAQPKLTFTRTNLPDGTNIFLLDY